LAKKKRFLQSLGRKHLSGRWFESTNQERYAPRLGFIKPSKYTLLPPTSSKHSKRSNVRLSMIYCFTRRRPDFKRPLECIMTNVFGSLRLLHNWHFIFRLLTWQRRRNTPDG
jgi:hypothetical protein